MVATPLLVRGFECEFVETVPDNIQTKCLFCQLIIRDPYQADCCGSGFCHKCIESIKSSKKPCPSCKATDFQPVKDTRLKRTLDSMKVYCSFASQGCQWVGELGKLDDHLSCNTSEQDQLNGCEFVQINCPYCSMLIKRSEFQVHRSMKCPKRPSCCEYCCNFTGTYDAVISHWLQCENYPETCPNNCGSQIRRQLIIKHMQNDCPEQGIHCKFEDIGCNAGIIIRKKMHTHMCEYMKTHVSLLEIHNNHLIEQLEEKIQVMDRIRGNNRRLSVENQTLKLRTNEQQQEIERLTLENQILHSHTLICPTEITMPNFQRYMNEEDTWYSRPFYTHPLGYKLSLRIIANGQNEGYGTHASLRIHLMKGEFDDELQWPFRANIIIEVINQRRDDEPFTKVVSFDDSASDNTSGRVTTQEASEYGRGASKFISHARLTSKYLNNDCLTMSITVGSLNMS